MDEPYDSRPLPEVSIRHHILGNENCDKGLCSENGVFPWPCQCGGFLHAASNRDSEWEWTIWLKCDRCGRVLGGHYGGWSFWDGQQFVDI